MEKEEKDRALNLLQNGLLPQVHGAYHDALEMAIESLQTEHCEDCISRQAAIDALKQQAEEMSHWSERYAEQRKGILTAINIVSDLPSAQPEQACREDKMKVLKKIRDEIIDTGAYEQETKGRTEFLKGINYCLSVIDEYMTESEEL